MGPQYNGKIVDLLITQFGIGIFLQYFIGEFELNFHIMRSIIRAHMFKGHLTYWVYHIEKMFGIL